MKPKLLLAPTVKSINKDEVIEGLKRKLVATEYQRDLYKENWVNSERLAHKYWSEFRDYKNQ